MNYPKQQFAAMTVGLVVGTLVVVVGGHLVLALAGYTVGFLATMYLVCGRW